MNYAPTDNCITLDELKQLIQSKKQHLKIIDVRSYEEYDECHIPDAINIVISQLDKDTLLLNKTDDFIITVCGKGGGRSTQAAKKLKELGFKNSNWLCGGTFGWYKN